MKTKRILMTVLGVCFGAVSVGFFKLAAFGVDPFQVTMSGIDQVFTLDFGFVWIFFVMILLARIFEYGQQLQLESDETL